MVGRYETWGDDGEWRITTVLTLDDGGWFSLAEDWTSYAGGTAYSASGTWKLEGTRLELRVLSSTASAYPAGSVVACVAGAKSVQLPDGAFLTRVEER